MLRSLCEELKKVEGCDAHLDEQPPTPRQATSTTSSRNASQRTGTPRINECHTSTHCRVGCITVAAAVGADSKSTGSSTCAIEGETSEGDDHTC